jgi:2-aminoadipate transaminase
MVMDAVDPTRLSAEAESALERAAAGPDHRHESLFARRAGNIKQSAVRDIFEISARPGLISLAGGNPSLETLPLAELGATAARLVAQEGLVALQYGSGQGTYELRSQICEVMAAEGISSAVPEDVVVTTGSQAAQDVAARIFCDPGDVVLCEDPTYVGALNTFEAYQAEVQPVAMDADGLIPEALSERITALPNLGKRIKLLYTIPSFNNPGGANMPAQRRRQVVDICREHNIMVLEDNPYGLLRFDGRPLAPMRADNPDDVVYLGSFSKIFAPGVRLGWAVVPRHLYRRFYLACEAAVLCPSPLSQMLVSAYLREQPWREHIAGLRTLYAERCAAMLAALDEHMPAGVSWSRPKGGFFIWVTLPEGVDTYPLLHEAVDAGVAFIPGAAFTPADEPCNTLRLAFSAVPPSEIVEAVRRLAPVIGRAVAGRAVAR